jgi:hypothetical protein
VTDHQTLEYDLAPPIGYVLSFIPAAHPILGLGTRD